MQLKYSKENLKKLCLESGFDLFGVASAHDPELQAASSHYERWLNAGFGASMEYLSRHKDTKSNPDRFLKDVKSVVVVGYTYGDPDSPNFKENENQSTALVSQYTRGDDYHEILTQKLKKIVEQYASSNEVSCRIFVDSSPVFDRFWAERAGLGWTGKNTCLINRKAGSYLFIGGFFTTESFSDFDTPGTDHCGKCMKCIDACPTDAIRGPDENIYRYYVDSNLCIAYHTIENRGEIPQEIQEKMGNWIAGCDICQQVCPWNDPVTKATEYKTSNPAYGAAIAELARWTRADFEEKLALKAMSRMKYEGFSRNLSLKVDRK